MLVVGTGAVATFLIKKLMRFDQGLQVFGPQSRRLEALSRLGVKVAPTVEAIEPHRLWVVCTKTTQNTTKVAALGEAPSPERILVLQNGLYPEQAWTNLALSERGLTTYGVRCPEPGHVVGGQVGEITLLEGSCFRPALERAGLKVREALSMEGAIWSKLVVNASLNVVCSILGCRNGELLESAWGLPRALGAAYEVARLAKAQGICLDTQDPVGLVESVARNTSQNLCSTLLDLRRGRRSEYEQINGELLRLAKRLGVPVPYLEELDREFRQLATQAQERHTLAS